MGKCFLFVFVIMVVGVACGIFSAWQDDTSYSVLTEAGQVRQAKYQEYKQEKKEDRLRERKEERFRRRYEREHGQE